MVPVRSAWTRTPAVRYGFALVATAAAASFRALLDPVLGEQVPLTTFHCAVAMAAAFGGLGPGLLALGLGYGVADWMFIAPRGSMGWTDAASVTRFVSYIVSGSLIVGLCVGLRRGYERERAARTALEAEAASREALAKQASEAEAQLNAELSARLDELQTLLEILPVAVLRGDASCRSVLGNRAAAAAFGLPDGADLAEAGRTDGRLEPLLLAARTGKAVQDHELDVPGPDGRPQSFLCNVAPLLDADGSVRGIVGAYASITERKRSEAETLRLNAQLRAQAEELRLASSRVRLLWESASVIMRMAKPKDMMRDLFTRIGPQVGVDACFNYVLDEGHSVLRLDSSMGVPEDHAEHAATLDVGEGACGRAAATRRTLVVPDVQSSSDPALDGLRRLGLRAYVCNPLLAGDRLLGTLGFGSRTKDAFSEPELDLLRTISQHVSVAFERMRLIEQLREADARKDEFLATLAHELRNPLAPLQNAAQVLSLLEHPEPEFAVARGLIDRQLRQLTRLVDDLLDVARITRGKVNVKKEHVDLATVVRHAIEAARPAIDAGSHELSVRLPTEPVRLHADPSRLAQVIGNLLHNAAKYSDPHGRIRLSAEREGDSLLLRVRDEGIGIAPDHLPAIFDMFSQAQPALERSQGGLGIGLALVKGIVELHGGTVSAQSEGLGRGTEFTVRLPVDREAAPADDPGPSVAAPGQSARRRILVVDDNRDAVDGLLLVLRRLGHHVTAAHDGLDCIRKAAELRPEVVLLDIGLPIMNGYDAAKYIREQPWGRSMELIALTGWGQDEDKRRAAEAGFDLHLTKPVELSALTKILEGGAARA